MSTSYWRYKYFRLSRLLGLYEQKFKLRGTFSWFLSKMFQYSHVIFLNFLVTSLNKKKLMKKMVEQKAPGMCLPIQTKISLVESDLCHYFETLECVEGLQLPVGKLGWYIWLNFHKFYLLAQYSSHPSPTHGRQLCTCS